MTDISAHAAATEASFGDYVALLKPRVMTLVVFTAENPWTAATWDGVSRLSPEALARTALVGVKRNGITYPVLCVEPISKEKSAEWELEALRQAGARHDHTRRIDTFTIVMAFPVDVRHNSKINREQLAVWADKVLGPTWNGGPA